jgi:hypothetical protein
MRTSKFGPTFFGALITQSAPWEISLAKAGIEVRHTRKTEASELKYEAITAIRCDVGWFWARLHIETAGRSLTFSGIGKGQGQRLSSEIGQRVTQP